MGLLHMIRLRLGERQFDQLRDELLAAMQEQQGSSHRDLTPAESVRCVFNAVEIVCSRLLTAPVLAPGDLAGKLHQMKEHFVAEQDFESACACRDAADILKKLPKGDPPKP